MKPYLKMVLALLLLMFGVVASSPAMAQRGGHGGGHIGAHAGGYGHGWGWGGVGLGIALGSLYWPGYYGGYYSYPYGYPAPAYSYPSPPTAYVDQGVLQAAPSQPQGDWYYCASSNAYYPYVRECPAGWQRVPSVPSR